jgi:hypothetical protein
MSKKKESFVARMYHYISGEMTLVVKEFDRIEDAIEDGIAAAAHSYKVYDTNGDICHDSHHPHKPHKPHCDDDDSYA